MTDGFDNPMGLMGFEFAAFASSTPGLLEPVFKRRGFTWVAKHRSRDLVLCCQRQINFIINREPRSVAAYVAAEHEPSVCGMAFRVQDAHHACNRALALGAQPIDIPTGPKALRLPAITGTGGAPLYLIDRFEDGKSIDDIDFVIFPPRILVARHTFRPPWFHRNLASEFMGLVHGPDTANFAKASQAYTTQPHAITDTMAFMLETRCEPRPTAQALACLQSAANAARGGFDIALEVWLQTPAMQAAGHADDCVSISNYRDAYWTVAQLVAHHTVGGCNLRTGDLLGTGTLSGPGVRQGGSMMELGAGGQQPLLLSNGELRAWLQDGGTVTLRGYCQQPGFRRIGFGDCSGTVLAVKQLPQPV